MERSKVRYRRRRRRQMRAKHMNISWRRVVRRRLQMTLMVHVAMFEILIASRRASGFSMI